MASWLDIFDIVGKVAGVASTAKSIYDSFDDKYQPQPTVSTVGTSPTDYLDLATQIQERFPEYSKLPATPELPTLEAAMPGATAGEQQATQALASSEAALRAALDPGSPEFKALAESEEQMARQSFLKSLRDMMSADRRAKSMGRPGIFGEERGSEQIARSFMEAGQRADLEAKGSARSLLTGVSDKYRGLGSQYADLGRIERGRQEAFREDIGTRLQQQRSDIMAKSEQERGDIRYNEKQRQQDIMASINAAMGITPKVAGQQQARTASEQAATAAGREREQVRYNQIQDLLNKVGGFLKTQSSKTNPEPEYEYA